MIESAPAFFPLLLPKRFDCSKMRCAVSYVSNIRFNVPFHFNFGREWFLHTWHDLKSRCKYYGIACCFSNRLKSI